jgi:hypothetical protein
MEVNGQFFAPAALPLGKHHLLYPLDGRPVRPRTHLDTVEKIKILLLLPEIELRPFSP